jgi:hypothetical protein
VTLLEWDDDGLLCEGVSERKVLVELVGVVRHQADETCMAWGVSARLGEGSVE